MNPMMLRLGLGRSAELSRVKTTPLPAAFAMTTV